MKFLVKEFKKCKYDFKIVFALLCLGSYRPIFAESAPGSKVRQKQQILCVLLSRRKICNPILNTPMIVYAQSALHSSEWGKLFSGCNMYLYYIYIGNLLAYPDKILKEYIVKM